MAPQSVMDTSFFGHPKGLRTLFFTEMWERFSYYGNRAVLFLYMTAAVSAGGLGMETATAGAIYGIFTACVYLLSLPGGWFADRITGQRKAVFYGGCIIALGNLLLAASTTLTFYAGLGLICVGTGLLKTNASTLVGSLYEQGDNRRDGGFSIYYMGINAGAFLAPLFVGYLAQRVGWRYGFVLVTIGMIAGLIQYKLTESTLGESGLAPVTPPGDAERKTMYTGAAVVIGIPLLIGVLQTMGITSWTAVDLADAFFVVLALCFAGVFALLWRGCENDRERKNIFLIFCLLIASVVFWSSFEQAGSTLNLFADAKTNNVLFGYEYPSTWFQSLNSIFLICLAPLFSMLWIRLGKNDLSVAMKFSLALLFVGLGYLVLVAPAKDADQNIKVAPYWLIATYFFHTIGELCLSPVGLSAMTKLAPARLGGVIMGVFFMSIATGNYIGGRMAGFYASMKIEDLFFYIALFGIAAGLLFAAFSRPLARYTGDNQ
jgi:POT family proton-dependent oligopeptide transporter